MHNHKSMLQKAYSLAKQGDVVLVVYGSSLEEVTLNVRDILPYQSHSLYRFESGGVILFMKEVLDDDELSVQISAMQLHHIFFLPCCSNRTMFRQRHLYEIRLRWARPPEEVSGVFTPDYNIPEGLKNINKSGKGYTMSDQRKLKLRLQFKQANIKVNSIIAWNFGYCPSRSPSFDKALEELNQLVETAKELYPDLYGEFMTVLDNQ